MLTNYKELVENNIDFIWEVNLKGEYTYVNDAAKNILGFEKEEILGKTPFDFMCEKEKEKVSHIFLNAVKNKKILHKIENKNIHKDGKEIILETSGKPILDENNELIGYSGIDRDITEKKKLQNELEVLLKEKEELLLQKSKMAEMGDMLNNIAHQWRQPLSMIMTTVSGIKIKKELYVLEDIELIQYMNNIQKSTEYLSQTIDDFKNYFNPNKEKTICELPIIINTTLNIMSSQFSNLDIEIETNIDDVKVKIVKNELIQSLINILNNAKDALQKQENEKLIIINVNKIDNNINITIQDNAGGIPSNILDKIFEYYFTTKKLNGTGIGLYITKEIINKNLNGEITAKNVSFKHNDKEHYGAMFCISLPIE